MNIDGLTWLKYLLVGVMETIVHNRNVAKSNENPTFCGIQAIRDPWQTSKGSKRCMNAIHFSLKQATDSSGTTTAVQNWSTITALTPSSLSLSKSVSSLHPDLPLVYCVLGDSKKNGYFAVRLTISVTPPPLLWSSLCEIFLVCFSSWIMILSICSELDFTPEKSFSSNYKNFQLLLTTAAALSQNSQIAV